jgi:hypothetical protein
VTTVLGGAHATTATTQSMRSGKAPSSRQRRKAVTITSLASPVYDNDLQR